MVSDWLKIRITSEPGNSFLDRMIALVEGASRKKTPNEIALTTLLVSLTIIFLIVIVTLYPIGVYSGVSLPTSTLIALMVCLIPTTIGGLLSAIGIAGMDRVTRFNVIAMSGKAVEACGDVDTMILDKTGTITYGNRLAADFFPVEGREPQRAHPLRRADQPARRNTRGQIHPGAGPPAGGQQCGAGGVCLPGIHGPDPDERRGPARRHQGPQGSVRRD